jgi:rhomboid protease GluP
LSSDEERDDGREASDGDERQNDRGRSSESDDPVESDDAGFLVDNSGNVEPVGSDEGIGGPEQDFGGIFSGGAFRGRQRFQLTEPSFWSRPLRLGLLVLGILYVGSILPDVLTGQLSFWILVGFVGVPLLAVAAVAYRAWKIPDEGLEIVFREEGIEMPKGADNPSYVDVDFHDLRSLVVMVRGESEALVMETEKRRFMFSSGDFREPNGPRLLKDAIMRRVKNHPDGQAIIDRMQALEERAREASQNQTPVMYGLLGMVIVGYVIELTTGALSSQFGLIQIGANSTPLIADGQWWRLISGNFLHGGFVHIFLNGLALFFLGMFIERLVGSWRFALVYLISAVGGAAGSYLWTGAPLSVGASTALYGLFGSFGVLHLKYWREIPPPYRQTIRWWIGIGGLNIALTLVVPGIDAAAHFAGLGVGVVATFLSLLDMPDLRPQFDAATWVKVAAGALTALFAAGLGMAWNYAQYEHPGDRTAVYSYMVERGEKNESATELNQTAWLIAVDPDSNVRQLDTAREAARSAIQMTDPSEAETDEQKRRAREKLVAFRDTLATVDYRLGMKGDDDETRREKFASAIRIERDVLREARKLEQEEGWIPSEWWASQEQTHRSQLARFLEAYHEEFGRYESGEGLSEEAALALEARQESLALRVDLPTRTAAQTEFIGLVFGEGDRLGAFKVCLAADAKGGIVERFGPNQWSTGMGPKSHIELAMTDTEEPMCSGDGKSVEYWPTAPDVRELP